MCLTVGDRMLIYSLKKRKLVRSKWVICVEVFTFISTRVHMNWYKGRRARFQKEPFPKSHFHLSNLQFMQKSVKFFYLVNRKKWYIIYLIHTFIFETTYMYENHKIKYIWKTSVPVQVSIRSVSSKCSFLIFLFICATAIKKVKNDTFVTV